MTGTPKLDSYEAVAALGREVVERGYRAFKTNIVVPGDEPRVLMPGFGRDGGTDRNPTPDLLEFGPSASAESTTLNCPRSGRLPP